MINNVSLIVDLNGGKAFLNLTSIFIDQWFKDSWAKVENTRACLIIEFSLQKRM